MRRLINFYVVNCFIHLSGVPRGVEHLSVIEYSGGFAYRSINIIFGEQK